MLMLKSANAVQYNAENYHRNLFRQIFEHALEQLRYSPVL